MEIKNYKELCSILEIKETTGGSKQKQLKELELYCKYKKEGYKFVIEDIYNKPILKLEDILKTKNSKYIKLLSNIILEYLYNNPNELKEIPLIKLFSVLGITNDNYSVANMYKKELSQLYNIQLASIYYFYSNTKNEYKKIIERCLNNLKNRSVLFWSTCIMIVDKKNNKTYKADEDEKKEILNIQKDTLEYLKYDNMYYLMKNKEDFKKFNDIINKEIGYNYYFAYDITVGDRAIEIEYNNILKSNMNNLIIDKTNKMFDKNKYIFYEDDYKILIDLLVNDNTEVDEKVLFTELYNKRIENRKKFNSGVVEATIKYNEELENLKITYLDE